ncbi:MAG: type II toxin-antitoxin system VapC family toxin [Desulfobulbaceae bacterium]|nr:type II toxin-antitoxin system VapC family toxin [Desulfobulbaceae bacterium]
MTRILVDSNILLDVVTEDKNWFSWSSEQLAKYAEQGELCINPIIYAEISIGFGRIEDMEEVLPREYFSYLALPYEAAFLAGKCFLKYRRAGGKKVNPLPDFFIGAHAAVEGMTLLSRDKNRYTTYFPKLEVVGFEAEDC